MDFVGPFPASLDYNYLWVVMCRLTSQVHLIPVKTTINALELAYEFLKGIVRCNRSIATRLETEERGRVVVDACTGSWMSVLRTV
jgi:hypothetical protein